MVDSFIVDLFQDAGGESCAQGAFDCVFKAVEKKTGIVVAIKPLYDPLIDDSRPRFLRELEILANNDHPATIHLLGFNSGGSEQCPALITEFFPGGFRGSLLKKEPDATLQMTSTHKRLPPSELRLA
jgi:serine/threonine protein kinase